MHPRSCYEKNWKQSLEWIRMNIDKNAEQEITTGKHKYLYPLNKKTRKDILILQQEYPK